jgi:hypothetical protein
MPLDPQKLAALVKQKNQAKPFGGEMPMDEEEPMDMGDEGEGEEEGGGEDEGFIELTPEEIEFIAEMVENGDGQPDLYDLAEELVEEIEAAEEEGVEPDQPPKWAASPAIWEKAEQAVDPEGAGSKYKEPYAVVTHVYRRMGGSIK